MLMIRMKIIYLQKINFLKINFDYFYNNVLIYYEKNKSLKKYKNFNFPNGIIYDHLAKDYFIIISGLIIKKEILERKGF